MTPELMALAKKARASVRRTAWNHIEREIASSTSGELKGYMLGAMHDGTFSARHGTIRIAQSDINWLVIMREVIQQLGFRSWGYREGRRQIYVLESSVRLPKLSKYASRGVLTAYARGYFDAEGGIPRDPGARFYVQFTQKDQLDLQVLKGILEDLGIECGWIHNPSVRIDPNYWRFFVRASGHPHFISRIGAWHPRKRGLLEARTANPSLPGSPPKASRRPVHHVPRHPATS